MSRLIGRGNGCIVSGLGTQLNRKLEVSEALPTRRELCHSMRLRMVSDLRPVAGLHFIVASIIFLPIRFLQCRSPDLTPKQVDVLGVIPSVKRIPALIRSYPLVHFRGRLRESASNSTSTRARRDEIEARLSIKQGDLG